MNPFETVVQNPWLPLWYISILLITLALWSILAAWVFYSTQKMWGWYESIMAAVETGRWDRLLAPPKDLIPELFWFAIIGACNLLLIAGGVFMIGVFVYVTV